MNLDLVLDKLERVAELVAPCDSNVQQLLFNVLKALPTMEECQTRKQRWRVQQLQSTLEQRMLAARNLANA